MTSKLIERLINKEYLTERERKEWLGHIKERLEVFKTELNNLQLDYDNKDMECIELYKENEKLKKAIEQEIELLIERRETFYITDSYDEYAVVNEIIEELKEVLGE